MHIMLALGNPTHTSDYLYCVETEDFILDPTMTLGELAVWAAEAYLSTDWRPWPTQDKDPYPLEARDRCFAMIMAEPVDGLQLTDADAGILWIRLITNPVTGDIRTLFAESSPGCLRIPVAAFPAWKFRSWSPPPRFGKTWIRTAYFRKADSDCPRKMTWCTRENALTEARPRGALMLRRLRDGYRTCDLPVADGSDFHLSVTHLDERMRNRPGFARRDNRQFVLILRDEIHMGEVPPPELEAQHQSTTLGEIVERIREAYLPFKGNATWRVQTETKNHRPKVSPPQPSSTAPPVHIHRIEADPGPRSNYLDVFSWKIGTDLRARLPDLPRPAGEEILCLRASDIWPGNIRDKSSPASVPARDIPTTELPGYAVGASVEELLGASRPRDPKRHGRFRSFHRRYAARNPVLTHPVPRGLSPRDKYLAAQSNRKIPRGIEIVLDRLDQINGSFTVTQRVSLELDPTMTVGEFSLKIVSPVLHPDSGNTTWALWALDTRGRSDCLVHIHLSDSGPTFACSRGIRPWMPLATAISRLFPGAQRVAFSEVKTTDHKTCCALSPHRRRREVTAVRFARASTPRGRNRFRRYLEGRTAPLVPRSARPPRPGSPGYMRPFPE